MSALAHIVLFDGPGLPLRHLRVPKPCPQTGEVLVRIQMCTLCGSDLHSFTGRRQVPCPSVLGHEILGVVEALPAGSPVAAADGALLRVGERVVWSVAAACGSCFRCRRGLPQKCLQLRKYGHEPQRGDDHLNGGLATHCLLRSGTAIVRVPDGLPDEVACPAGCATATVMAAVRAAGPVEDRAVLVQGAGMLGLTAAAVCREAGAGAVLVSDTSPERCQHALRFGATGVLDATLSAADQQAQIRRANGKDGVDVVFEMSGSRDSLEVGIGLLDVGGTYVWVGTVYPVGSLSIDPELVVRRLLSIRGVHNYHPVDLVGAVEFLKRKHTIYPFDELVSPRFGLDQVAQAFQTFQSLRPLRVAVTPAVSQST